MKKLKNTILIALPVFILALTACPTEPEPNPVVDAAEQPCLSSADCDQGLYCWDFYCHPLPPDAGYPDQGWLDDATVATDASSGDLNLADNAIYDVVNEDVGSEDVLPGDSGPEDAARADVASEDVRSEDVRSEDVVVVEDAG